MSLTAIVYIYMCVTRSNYSVSCFICQCNRQHSIKALFDQVPYSEPKRIALIGGGCSVATEAIAQVSYYFNITQVRCYSEYCNSYCYTSYIMIMNHLYSNYHTCCCVYSIHYTCMQISCSQAIAKVYSHYIYRLIYMSLNYRDESISFA